MKDRIKRIVKGLYLALRKILFFPVLIFRKPLLPKEGDINTILLLRHDRLGDMVVSTAVFEALKRRFPSSVIIVLASRRNAELIQSDPAVDEVVVYQGPIRYYKEFRRKKIDLAIDLFLTYELKQAFLTMLSGARYRLGFEKAGREVFFNVKGPVVASCRSMKEQLLELLKPLGVSGAGIEPRLVVSQEEKALAFDYLISRGFRKEDLNIAIHPGGFYPSQRWPVDRFVEVAKLCINRYGARIILFEDKFDKELIRGMEEKIGSRSIASGALSIRQFMASVAQCDLLLCNNSGPLHIAAALGVPTVSTLGPTDRNLWSPGGKKHIVLSGNLHCSPCSRISCAHHACMEAISVDEFMDAVGTQLKRMEKA
ncbi:MAG: glycosyltransferase family 9 protein [Candidatus Omnitrophica bacterium]|nr:glycosyltransferase family 9 protein [Candidatus Omnitrophota bacterium]